jgi:serine/threonine-protein kinase
MDETRLVDRYLLLDRHAIGGMATVWRAKDEWTGETVAIKRLHPHVVADPVARARLEREAEALRAIDHPAIVRPRELIDDADAPALVMDFVAGRPLDERIAAGPLPAEEAVAIAAVIADALAVAHDHGIVHRDIKPANILLDDDGAVHLVDFGIVALMDAPPDDLTAASTMVGTLRYAAPERLAGGAVSPRSDVWALGAVLFEMLTGRPAVPVVDPAGALAASRAAPPALDGLPSDLAEVVTRAMATEPADRYPDAITLRDALTVPNVVLDGEPPVDHDAATAVVPLAPSPPAQPAVAAASTSRGRRPPPARAGRMIALVVGGLIAASAVFAVAGSGTFTGAGSGAGGARASAAPSVRPTVAPTPEPTSDSGSGAAKGKGNGKGKGKGRGD